MALPPDPLSVTKNLLFDYSDRQRLYQRYFEIAGITVCVESCFDINRIRFKENLMSFAAGGPGEDNVTLRHYFELPDLEGKNLGKEVYRKPPWVISCNGNYWYYQAFSPAPGGQKLRRFAVFNNNYTCAFFYHLPRDKEMLLNDCWKSLSLLPTDQIWLSPLLADRQAVLLHAAGAIVNSKGLVFAGHSEAGKSTVMELLKSGRRARSLPVEILCDDRIVVRRWPDGWRVHGTWSHGTTTDVSAYSAPLQAIFFLEQALENKIVPLTERKPIWSNLLATLVKSMVTAEWWLKELDVLELLVKEVPCYTMFFDKSGAFLPELEQLLR